MPLDKKTAIVYGAAGAIGSAVARAYAREGADVHLTGRNRSDPSNRSPSASTAPAAPPAARGRAVWRHNAADWSGTKFLAVRSLVAGRRSVRFMVWE